MKVGEPPYKGMAEDFVRAGVEMGYPRIDLNAEFVQGITISILHCPIKPIAMPVLIALNKKITCPLFCRILTNLLHYCKGETLRHV